MKKPNFLLFLLFTLLGGSSSATARGSSVVYGQGCGANHSSVTCGYPYPCCSKSGECGDTVDYCGPGKCDPDYGTCWDPVPPPPPLPSAPPPSKDGCGSAHKDQSCKSPNPCCSKDGHCGYNVSHCAPPNCQPKYGICWDNDLIGDMFGKMELLNKF